MTMSRSILLATGALGLFGAAAALAGPKALAQVEGGLWEVTGQQGKKAPVRQCVADPLKLVELDHPGAKCTETVLEDKGTTVRLSLQCSGGGFGQASIKAVTPRNLRVEVQGIADGAPYGHTLQARRVGPCPAGPTGRPERGAH